MNFSRQALTKTKTGDSQLIKNYILQHSAKLTAEQHDLYQDTLKLPMAMMVSDPDQLYFLQNIVRLIGGKKTIDVGVFTGYSALSIALVLPADGKVVACDISDKHIGMGRPYWVKAGVEGKIDLRIAPAGETLQNLIDEGESETFDFAYIDADKPSYDDYYEKCLKLVRPGGIIALDNMLWGGSVAEENSGDPSTQALRKLNDKIYSDERVYSNLLSLGDGTVVVFKK